MFGFRKSVNCCLYYTRTGVDCASAREKFRIVKKRARPVVSRRACSDGQSAARHSGQPAGVMSLSVPLFVIWL